MNHSQTTIKTPSWSRLINLSLLVLAAVVFYTYWEGMMAPVLFSRQSFSIPALVLGLSLCGFHLILGLQCLSPTATSAISASSENVLADRTYFDILISAINFMFSLVVFSLVILVSMVDLNMLRLT
jgi:hypothetical protein